jgi:hypothetical protein
MIELQFHKDAGEAAIAKASMAGGAHPKKLSSPALRCELE